MALGQYGSSTTESNGSELEQFVTVEPLERDRPFISATLSPSAGPAGSSSNASGSGSIHSNSSRTAHVKVSSPDQVGLGCDLARVLFDFGLLVDSGDFSTDGTWVHMLFVVRSKHTHAPPWPLLRQRLEAVCPPARAIKPRAARAPQLQFVLRVDARDRLSLLHDVTAALWERELTVHRAVVTTSPSDRAVDLFYVSDNRRELPSEPRQSEVCEHVSHALGEPASSCQFTAAPVLASLMPSSLSSSVSPAGASFADNDDDSIGAISPHSEMADDQLIDARAGASPEQHAPSTSAAATAAASVAPHIRDSSEASRNIVSTPTIASSSDGVHAAATINDNHIQSWRKQFQADSRSSPHKTSSPAGLQVSAPARNISLAERERRNTGSASASAVAEVAVDRLTSRAHTVLHIRVPDRQGLFYDCMRCMKDLGVSVSYGRVLLPSTGLCAANDGSRKYATCEIVLFLNRLHQHEEAVVCEALQQAVERPWSVSIANVGLDGQCTQLLVRAMLDAAGSARPRVLLDVTEALRRLSVWVFKADIKASGSEHGAVREEVHTFLLTDHRGQAIEDASFRNKICAQVERALMGEMR